MTKRAPVNVVENVVDDTRRDAAERRVAVHSFHCVRFTRGCLTVSKYCAIISREHVLREQRGIA